MVAGMVQDEGSSSVTTSSPLRSFSMMSLSPAAGAGPPPWLRELKSDERGLYLIHLLLNCATHVATGALDQADAFLEHISLLSSVDGDTMQRIAACFTDALARRALRSWPGLNSALTPPRPSPAEIAAARHCFLDICPFLKLAYLASNQAILESMEGERVVHIVDLGAADPVQWLALLQAFRARPEGPPHLRITGVGEHKDLLDATALRLCEEAEKLDIPFQFNSVVSRTENLDFEMLRVKTGEAVAINSVIQLHRLLALDADNRNKTYPRKVNQYSLAAAAGTLRELIDKESTVKSPDSASSSPFALTSSSPKTEGFLTSLWGLSPKIVVVTEQESNHNAAELKDRFVEALNYYAALFDCLESTTPRLSPERARVERLLFGEEIKNIIACEGAERRERHEKLERWAQRMELAGFARVAMSYYGLLQVRRLLQSYGCEGYKVREENCCFQLCWQDRALFSVSAWRSRRFN